MSDLPISERLAEAFDGVAPFTLDDDGFARAALIFQNARVEADRAHAACAKLPPAGLSEWRRPGRSAALHRRMMTRFRALAARQFLAEAMRDWRPQGPGN